MKYSLMVLACVLPLTAGVCVAQETQPASQPTTKPLTEAQIIARELASADQAVHNAAWEQVQKLLNSPRELDGRGRPRAVVDPSWVRSLTRVKRYDDAESLAVTGIVRRPFDGYAVATFAKTRAANFRAAGKFEPALAAAKAAYLVSTLVESSAVADQLSAAVLKVRPKDKAATEAFKAQQVDGATPTGENLLKTIPSEPKPYEATLQAIKGDEATACISRGNLLLLSDRPADAKVEFEAALDAARIERDALAALEGIAKCMRAETGSVTAANAFLADRLKDKPAD